MNKKRLGLVLSALMFAAVLVSNFGSVAPAHAQGPEGTDAVTTWNTNGNKGNNKSFIGTTNNKPFVFKTNNVERMRIEKDGNIGIGTNNPSQTLQVNGMTLLGENGGVYGFTARDGENLYPTLSFNETGAPNYAAGYEGYGGVFQFHTNSGNLTYYTGPAALVGGARINTPRMTIDANGNVGIGETEPSTTLEVKGTLSVTNDSNLFTLFAHPDRTVSVGALAESTTHHLCYFGTYTLSTCSSAAEYVPSIDAGKGFPETADLVSIAPKVKNPYGDAHGPFVVQKSPKACDENLLGYIVKPESGADGVYKNEHYLPLAIYGYFPAKVTMENGAIQRGDAITSSSKAGYGMKATDACKVIGYALEDASAEGTIQVFANFGDNAAAQVQALKQENDALKKMLSKFETRLAALEGTAPVAMRVTDPLATVKGYYSALQNKDIETALQFLADDVVLLKTETPGGFSETVQGVQAVRNALAYSNVLSFAAEHFQANGDKVTYTMTEWLDPRIVGPNYPQPHKSNLVAVVADGKIVSITETLDADLALRTK